MSQYYVSTAIIGSIGVYYGYYYVKGYVQNYVQNYVMERVMEELNKKQDQDSEIFKPMEKSKSAIILYNHGGKSHNICVPYDRSKSRKMLRKEVFLVRSDSDQVNNNYENEQRVEITHKPGVPYSLCAKDMGGTKIIVTKDGETIREYGEDEIPNFLD